MRVTHALLSFHYYRDVDLDQMLADAWTDPADYPTLFADSGAYSAMTQNKPIDVADYAAWLERWSHLFHMRANLDVIGDWQASAANLRHLEESGHDVLPVFHPNEPWDLLDEMADRYNYLALGGTVGFHWTRQAPWFVECLRRVNGRAKIHAFGLTSQEAMRVLPFDSFDSSSWTAGHVWGKIHTFDGRRISMNNPRTDPKIFRLGKELRELHGIDVQTLYDGGCTWQELARINMRTWIRFVDTLRSHNRPNLVVYYASSNVPTWKAVANLDREPQPA